ncbi:asparagine synthetase [glutamine-hydrolyzing] [Harmonia axyridis]|uniref:asparagine synthetase [glutamine-hydrolyzing] n=1 Tax=Harmonia axyridis TaxID=115357 RepID=UPI001E278FB6|nr:asparagine synthetase [glutamine-hydrolyzing] [Harmonia axyridis]XP_045470041.1 asparagine synthetase [glutamine-hydrolyzing] [Harmonia axyridis]XP_045470042.1 asparagine synthetase [glutamine-hydrolyzing] [Harmonia axyridis]
MCGIWAIFGVENPPKFCACTFPKIGHRGPDAFRIECDRILKNSCLGFHRLAIVDPIWGMQPLRLHLYPHIMLICNGEIYNYKSLKEEFDFKYETAVDVESIVHLYETFGIEGVVKNLDGVFAFCLVDLKKKKIFLARDPYGVRPLFKLISKSGVLGICSEAKGLVDVEHDLNGEEKSLAPFKPGTFEEYQVLDSGKVKLIQQSNFHKPGDKPSFKTYVPYESLANNDVLSNIRTLLTAAVKKRLMADRRIGCLLSGGLDSSLIASLLVREAKKANIPYKVQSFAIGMGDSPDLKAARKVADFIGTEHHEITFTEEDVEKVLDDVIYTLETPDITTIRASIPMYLLAKYIQENTDTTVILSGEGADEVAQGYIYFRDAPDASSAHKESLRLLSEIYMFDGLRADRTTSSQSLELRVPFLDLQFTNYYLSTEEHSRQPKDKSIEKYLLRSAFDSDNLLPHDILWRHKEAFSDGVASQKKSLFVILQEIVDKRMSEKYDKNSAAEKYPHCTPTTKESLYYRKIFEKSFENLADNFLPYYWMPRWVKGVTDPSARFIQHYDAKE